MIRDLIALENTSRVWLYQADRMLSYDELDYARPRVMEFLENWTSHNHQLMTYGNIFHRQFLGLFVDESMSGASGCSIDKSVHFVEALGAKLGVDFFNRRRFAYLIDDEVKQIGIDDLKQSYNSGIITENTLFFDNLVSTKGDFLSKWLVPLSDSWINRFV